VGNAIAGDDPGSANFSRERCGQVGDLLPGEPMQVTVTDVAESRLAGASRDGTREEFDNRCWLGHFDMMARSCSGRNYGDGLLLHRVLRTRVGA
jgi:hypothetical protein